ncbi:hypothetical protein F4553_000207 [Allocatelliglobosispora scoriae]|uniref:Uncharacterized protein n=1 Tax=Allocatelliglobosispora scoriae TaxID=643052 RepID=A0A841BHM7_9ACTN|nr:hypothetical protein [Allocatelliglobosispora scoriae]MBB5866828.1 hypothetical protein [Allocatelliglobosispora scoriae]
MLVHGCSPRPIGAITVTWHAEPSDPLVLEQLRRAAMAATAALRSPPAQRRPELPAARRS